MADGSPVTDDHREIDPKTGMQKGYVVLSAEERSKGYVRPVRSTYIHTGTLPKYFTRDLTSEEQERYKAFGYVKFEEYPESESPVTGRYWTHAQLNLGCGYATSMGSAIAETYARDPSFYGATFCSHCGDHFPLNQFIWKGTNEQVGS